MNTLVLLMALLGLSYLSGMFGRRRSLRSLGLPSASVWMIVGFLLGPDLLGLIDRAVQADVEPMIYVAVGWVALVIGLDYGVVRSRRLRGSRIVLGIILGVLTVGAIAGAVWWSVPYVAPELAVADRLVLALGLGAVGSESTSNAVAWVAARKGVRGPLAEVLDDLAEAKDVAPILAAGVALCLHARVELPLPEQLSRFVVPAVVVVTGAMLGAVAAMMLAREERVDQSWGIIVGVALLAIGTCARLRLPGMAALFFVGLVIGVASRHRNRLLALIEPTKRSALMPMLLLAGARLSPRMVLHYAGFIAITIAVRTLVLMLTGRAVTPVRARDAAPLVGLAMMPAGEISITLALTFALACPGFVGDCVLVAAVGVTVVGEVIGPLAMRASLRRAGELTAVSDNSAEIVL